MSTRFRASSPVLFTLRNDVQSAGQLRRPQQCISRCIISGGTQSSAKWCPLSSYRVSKTSRRDGKGEKERSHPSRATRPSADHRRRRCRSAKSRVWPLSTLARWLELIYGRQCHPYPRYPSRWQPLAWQRSRKRIRPCPVHPRRSSNLSNQAGCSLANTCNLPHDCSRSKQADQLPADPERACPTPEHQQTRPGPVLHSEPEPLTSSGHSPAPAGSNRTPRLPAQDPARSKPVAAVTRSQGARLWG